MAAKTNKSKTNAAASKKAAPKTNARAANVAPKRKPKAVAAAVAHTAAKPFENVDVKTALFGAGIGAALGTLATKLIFFR